MYTNLTLNDDNHTDWCEGSMKGSGQMNRAYHQYPELLPPPRSQSKPVTEPIQPPKQEYIQEPPQNQTQQFKKAPEIFNQQICENIEGFNTLLTKIFQDVSDHNMVLDGPCKQYDISVNKLKAFNYGIDGESLYGQINHIFQMYINGPDSYLIRPTCKDLILKTVARLINERESTGQFPEFVQWTHGSITATNDELASKELSTAMRKLSGYAQTKGKIVFTNYEIKFQYRSSFVPKTDEESPIFIDSEGLVLPIRNPEYQKDDNYDEGILIIKTTPTSSKDEPFSMVPLPTLGNYVSSHVLNGVFFSSLNEFKKYYNKKLNCDYNKSTTTERIFNVKKLVGSILFNGVTETSHGLVSSIVGYSLDRESFWTCTHDSISEIVNITKKSLGDVEFMKELSNVGLTLDSLENKDIIVRKTNIGPGSGKSSSQETRFEKIKISRDSGFNNMKNRVMDEDLALFNETGIAIFLSKEAAERCLKYGGGDPEKYALHLSEKISKKSEKNIFVDTLKTTAIMGVGAAIPKVIETIITQVNKPAEVAFKMGLMKEMLPPIASTVTSFMGKTIFTSGMLATMGAVAAPVAGFIGIVSTVSNLINGKGFIMGFFSRVRTMFKGAINGFRRLAGIAEGASIGDAIVCVGKSVWNGVKNAGITVWRWIKNGVLFIRDSGIKIFSDIEGEGFFGKAACIAKRTFGVAKDIAKGAWDCACGAVKWVGESIGSLWSGACSIFGF